MITPVFSRITRFFPPLVTGIVITTIGLTLMPVAAFWAMGGNKASPDFGSTANIQLAAVTLIIVLLLSKLGSASISRLSILLSIVIGTGIAYVAGMTDFSQVANGPVFALPKIFHFGYPTFELAAIISMLIVIMVTLVETSADILAVGEIVETKVDSRRLGDGLRADMLSSILAPIVGSFTQSAFAQNVGLVAVTGVKSRYVVATGGLFLVTLGLLPIMGRIVASVPTSVLGGAGIVLFGTVAASGIRTLSKVEYNNNMNLVIVATSIGFGMIPIAAPVSTSISRPGSRRSSILASRRRQSWRSCSTCCSITSRLETRTSSRCSSRRRSARSATRILRGFMTATISSTASSMTPRASRCH